MIIHITGLLKEIWYLLNEMSPYLLFGFFSAGILHILIPKEKIYKHFAKNDLSGIIKASLFGVPLPLCSCGGIPVAAHLRKEGAGKSSTIAFLTSTPTTGVDSILATYSLLGPLFAIIRPVSAFTAGILSGVVSSLFEKDEHINISENSSCTICDIDTPHTHSLYSKIKKIISYGFFDLVSDIWKWLAIGILVGGILSYFVPTDIVQKYLGNSLISYPLMLVIAIPMYVCATGSIPIAAALILKGMTPGAGLIFLFAGPATNTATLSFVAGKLGKKSLLVYLTTIITTAIAFGLLIDFIWYSYGKDIGFISGKMEMLPQWLKIISSWFLITLVLIAALPKREKEIIYMDIELKVPDITCAHCVKTIKSAISKVNGVKDVGVNIKTKTVKVKGDISKENVVSVIKKSGYSVEEE